MASLLLVFALALAVFVPGPAGSAPAPAPAPAYFAPSVSAPTYSGSLLYTYTAARVAGTPHKGMPQGSGGEENHPGQGDYGHIMGMRLPHWVIILIVLGAVAILAVGVVLAIYCYGKHPIVIRFRKGDLNVHIGDAPGPGDAP